MSRSDDGNDEYVIRVRGKNFVYFARMSCFVTEMTNFFRFTMVVHGAAIARFFPRGG